MDNFIKKRKTSITPALKKAAWDLYIGIGIISTKCPLCGIVEVSRNTNSGFEGAHIIPDKWYTDTLTILYLFPSCEKCNNDCSTYNLLDYLWCRERYDILRNMIWSIYSHYIRERPQEKNSQAWKILDHLYGRDRFPVEGHIVNRTGIYRLATAVQIQHIAEETAELSRRLKENADLAERLSIAVYPDERPRFT